MKVQKTFPKRTQKMTILKYIDDNIEGWIVTQKEITITINDGEEENKCIS